VRRKLEVELEAPPLNSKIPLYLQIKEHLRAQVLSGRLPPGTMLPSEEELGKIYGVSRPTVRQAIGELEREGLLERHEGGRHHRRATQDPAQPERGAGFHRAHGVGGPAALLTVARAVRGDR